MKIFKSTSILKLGTFNYCENTMESIMNIMRTEIACKSTVKKAGVLNEVRLTEIVWQIKTVLCFRRKKDLHSQQQESQKHEILTR